MSALTVFAVGMIALFVLIVARVPIGIAMIIVGVGGFAVQHGSFSAALTLLAGDPVLYLGSVDLAAIPLFLLMGTFATAAGFSADLYSVAAAFLGHRRGGLAYASIGGAAAFGCVCGSSIATAGTFAKVALPEMLRRGYDPGFAAGTIAAGGALKNLIPPALVMILYSIVAQTFILDLFVAAIIPAILVVILNIAAVAVTTALYPALAPVNDRAPWSARTAALKRAGPAFLLILTVFGGLYSGVFTINEAASVAAILALVFAIIRGGSDWKRISNGIFEAAKVTGMIYVLVFGAGVFSYFMNVAGVPQALVSGVGEIQLPATLIIAALLAVYLVLGAVFDEVTAMLITLPFVLPIVVDLGYDPLWWGVMMLIVIEIGMISPPIGIIVFVLHGMARDIPLSAIYRGVTPFILADLILLVALTLAPSIATWLPQILK